MTVKSAPPADSAGKDETSPPSAPAETNVRVTSRAKSLSNMLLRASAPNTHARRKGAECRTRGRAPHLCVPSAVSRRRLSSPFHPKPHQGAHTLCHKARGPVVKLALVCRGGHERKDWCEVRGGMRVGWQAPGRPRRACGRSSACCQGHAASQWIHAAAPPRQARRQRQGGGCERRGCERRLAAQRGLARAERRLTRERRFLSVAASAGSSGSARGDNGAVSDTAAAFSSAAPRWPRAPA